MRGNLKFIVVFLCILCFLTVGCTQKGPRYMFHPVDKSALSKEEASNISSVVLDMGNKGFTTHEAAFTKVILKTGEERLVVTDKEGITKGRVVAEAVGGTFNGAASAAILGGFQYKAAGRQSDKIVSNSDSGDNVNKVGAAAGGGGVDID